MHQTTSYWLLTAAHTYRKLLRGQNGVGCLHKECDGSENGTADTTICPLHYRKEANTDEKFLTNSKCHKAKSSSNVNRNPM